MKRLLALLLACAAAGAAAQEPPDLDPTEILNTLLTGLLGFREVTGQELQSEVAEIGGIPFRRDVPLDYMKRDELARYLQELMDAEYPPERARADERTLRGFGLLPPGTELRALRAKLLLENVAGFYDERPGRKRLYAVSASRELTPANQLILSHELRHALQDQYAEVHARLPDSIGDFDDRRMAFLSLLEGDATLVMERFLLRRVRPGSEVDPDLTGFSLPGVPEVPGAPPVLRDQLVLPYLIGREFAQSLWKKGGWDALKQAWAAPPRSTEQVLHPAKFFGGEEPRDVALAYAPAGARLVNEGVLGELLTRTLLGDGSDAAAEGWGGDRFRVWDVAGRTLLIWRVAWDTPADAREFGAAVRVAFRRDHGEPQRREGRETYRSGEWSFVWGEDAGGSWLASSDAPGALDTAVRALRP